MLCGKLVIVHCEIILRLGQVQGKMIHSWEVMVIQVMREEKIFRAHNQHYLSMMQTLFMTGNEGRYVCI
jgi:hypothetical protein